MPSRGWLGLGLGGPIPLGGTSDEIYCKAGIRISCQSISAPSHDPGCILVFSSWFFLLVLCHTLLAFHHPIYWSLLVWVIVVLFFWSCEKNGMTSVLKRVRTAGPAVESTMALYIEPAGRLGGAGTYKQLPRCSGIRRRATAKQIAGFALNVLCLLVSTP